MIQLLSFLGFFVGCLEKGTYIDFLYLKMFRKDYELDFTLNFIISCNEIS